MFLFRLTFTGLVTLKPANLDNHPCATYDQSSDVVQPSLALVCTFLVLLAQYSPCSPNRIPKSTASGRREIQRGWDPLYTWHSNNLWYSQSKCRQEVLLSSPAFFCLSGTYARPILTTHPCSYNIYLDYLDQYNGSDLNISPSSGSLKHHRPLLRALATYCRGSS